MRHRGFTLIECMVGMTVGSVVAALVLATLGSSGAAVRKHEMRTLGVHSAWIALGAMSDDLAQAVSWQICEEARDCTEGLRSRRSYRASMLVLTMPGPIRPDERRQVSWLWQGGLRRCEGACNVFVDDVQSLHVVADVPGPGGVIRRIPFHQLHGMAPQTIEVIIGLPGGRYFSRVVHRATSAQDAVTQGPVPRVATTKGSREEA